MEISISDLMCGKSTIIRGKEFFETKKYVMPFIERMKSETDDFRARVVAPSQLSVNPDGEIDQVFNKVLLEAVCPITHDLAEVYGMTYALDVRFPVVKFFKGIKENLESGHLYIDTLNNVSFLDLKPGEEIDFSKFDSLKVKQIKTMDWMDHLKTLDYEASNDGVNFSLGQWVRFALNIERSTDYGKIKVAYSDMVSGYKLLFEDEDSPFFKGLGRHITYFDIFNAMSSVIYNGRDIVSVAEKTVLLKQILSI